MSDDLEVIDWRGNPIRVGTCVLYPRMSGRSVEMQEGFVEEIKPVVRERYNYETKEREPVTEYSFKITRDRSSRFDKWAEKSVWILIGENVTAVTGS